MAKENKYALYELAVQSPETHTQWFVGIYKEIFGGYARRLREDFCGTFQLSCHWVKRNRRNSALALDLDPEPLAYGKRVHRARLSAEQRRRLKVVRENVLSISAEKADLIVACNFSFYVFKKRKVLVDYLRFCRRSLGRKGAIILEMAGGPGMIEPLKERKNVSRESGGKFTYIWDQQSFDPVTQDARYAIHFKFADGSQLKDAFTYDWRLWTIPEVREAVLEAGFDRALVYWETEHQGRGTGEFIQSESGDNAYSWVAYVVGVKDPQVSRR